MNQLSKIFLVIDVIYIVVALLFVLLTKKKKENSLVMFTVMVIGIMIVIAEIFIFDLTL